VFWLCVVFVVVGAAERIIIIRAGANMILTKEKVFFLSREKSTLSRQEFSLVCLGARTRRESNQNEESGSEIFCFLAATFQHKILAEIFG
jgi:hypothetical protein